MDERNFDQPTAVNWIKMIEGGSSLRDTDIYPRLREWLTRISPVTILDLGCGQGICSDKIDLSRSKYSGLEPSIYLVERARELYAQSDRHFYVGNAYAMPFGAAEFDAVFSVTVWHLLSDLGAAARELARVLKPGGDFLIITANPSSYLAWESLYMNIKSEGRRFEGSMLMGGETDVLYFHTLDEILASFVAEGFDIVTNETFRKSVRPPGFEMLIAIEGKFSGRSGRSD